MKFHLRQSTTSKHKSNRRKIGAKDDVEPINGRDYKVELSKKASRGGLTNSPPHDQIDSPIIRGSSTHSNNGNGDKTDSSRSSLMRDIQTFAAASLKKTVTKDKSSPRI